MVSLAVIIGISEYDGNSAENLPACEADARAIKNIIEKSGKYSDVLYIIKRSKSSDAKSKIIDFVSSHRNDEIDEILFYFSGHGHYDGQEFYYVMSDYHSNKLKQTTIENSEIDNLLRGLKPNMTVKIVDACNSGVGYIKDNDSIIDYIKSTGSNFEKCYFMFSSHNDQSSYASASISNFTRSFCMSIIEHPSASIRYKEIIDYISDEFSAEFRQKPLFVVQADFTEYFVNISDELRNSNMILLPVIPKSENVSESDKRSNVLGKVMAASTAYKDRDFLQSEIDSLRSESLFGSSPGELVDLFDIETTIKDNPHEMIDPEVVGSWIEKDKSNPPLFAASTGSFRSVNRRVPKGIYALTGITSNLFGNEDDDDKFTTKVFNEWKVDGFKYSEGLVFVGVASVLRPRYPALKKYEFQFFPIVSRTKLVAFSREIDYIEVGFGKYKTNSKSKWLFGETEFSNSGIIVDSARRKFSEFCKSVIEDVESNFGEAPSSPEVNGT